jgi:hypothetical protein
MLARPPLACMQAMKIGLPTVMRQCSTAASFVKANAGALVPIRQLNATMARAFAGRRAALERRILEALPGRIFKTSMTGRKILSKDCHRQQDRARSVVKSEGCIVFDIQGERTGLPFGIPMPLVDAVALKKLGGAWQYHLLSGRHWVPQPHRRSPNRRSYA